MCSVKFPMDQKILFSYRAVSLGNSSECGRQPLSGAASQVIILLDQWLYLRSTRWHVDGVGIEEITYNRRAESFYRVLDQVLEASKLIFYLQLIEYSLLSSHSSYVALLFRHQMPTRSILRRLSLHCSSSTLPHTLLGSYIQACQK